jgi:hypothetical protein
LHVSGAPRAGSPSHVSGAQQVRPVFAQLMRRSGLGQGENGII